MIINSEQEMLKFGEEFYDASHGRVTALEGVPRESRAGEDKSWQDPSRAIVIELLGDVGAGKTTFVRGLAKGLGIKDPVTSPSFTISKSYALKNGGFLIHYDFYRLHDPGIMVDDLAENLRNPNNIIVIEWGESVKNLLPKNHITIEINYTDTGREVTIK